MLADSGGRLAGGVGGCFSNLRHHFQWIAHKLHPLVHFWNHLLWNCLVLSADPTVLSSCKWSSRVLKSPPESVLTVCWETCRPVDCWRPFCWTNHPGGDAPVAQPECPRHVTQKKTHVFAVLTEGINLNEEPIIPFIRISPN